MSINLSDATILLVDDEPDLLEIFGGWIVAAGCNNVYTAKNGEVALSVLRNKPIDLIVTDVCMPIVDGVALVRCLVELDAPIPSIVFVSGFGDIDHREMYALGVEAFLTKPVPSRQLIEVAERALAQRSALWISPMDPPPRQSMKILVEEIREKTGQDPIRLGRGGFSTHYRGPVALGKIAFQCHFSSGRGEMAGEGYVRWRSRSDYAVGIEFAYLDERCRSWLLEEIAATDQRSFIPGLR